MARRTAGREHLSLEERKAKGKAAREMTPLASHAGWEPAVDRPDPVSLLEEQNRTREPDLVPVRHGRMRVSPFTFYRGTANIMAADLATGPTAGLSVQLCGDAHLSNFGIYASPERAMMFDLNDFDETLPGPFEYDVKRLAASFSVAARNNGFTPKESRAAARAAATSYREAMREFAEMRTMDIWYAHVTGDDLVGMIRDSRAKSSKSQRARSEAAMHKGLQKARTRDSLSALSKLAEVVDGRYRIVSQPPVVIPERELRATYGMSEEAVDAAIRERYRDYRATLQDNRRHLLEQFQLVDMARKVVGVGSVGTRAFIVLLQGRDEHDPLFLQIKEATASVLEGHLPRSRYGHHGARVVHGQRLMQSASDIYLGWTKGADASRHFYWRQLRDMKGSLDPELMVAPTLELYGQACGKTLARAHARSGDSVAIAAYLGSSDKFDRSITDFAERYADQNDRDYAAFVAAIDSGRLEELQGV